MRPYAERPSIALNPEQHHALIQMALREGQDIETFLEHLLQGILEEQDPEFHAQNNERIRQNFDLIRQHRKAVLAKRQNQPLTIDTVELLYQLRDERDEYLLGLFRNPRG